jgi:hypothetical protein
MNNRRTKSGLQGRGACGVAFWLAAACAWGGILPPLYVGNLEPVRDQYGRKMIGSYQPSGAANRSRVEIRTAADGIIRPPSSVGAAHPYNPLLSTDSIGGVGLNSAEPNSGIFCMVFSQRPAPGTKIFARAFNAPTAAEASFYADSAIIAAPTNGTSLVLVFSAAQPLDSGDADGDGLNNAWEKALGIDDRAAPDYDGDGMSDLFEMLAGTAPDDAASLLAFRSIQREAGAMPAGAGQTWTKPVRVKWQCVPGKKYRLEYVPNLTGEQIFIPVGDVVTAGEGEFEMDLRVDVSDQSVSGAFRVKLVTE